MFMMIFYISRVTDLTHAKSAPGIPSNFVGTRLDVINKVTHLTSGMLAARFSKFARLFSHKRLHWSFSPKLSSKSKGAFTQVS